MMVEMQCGMCAVVWNELWDSGMCNLYLTVAMCMAWCAVQCGPVVEWCAEMEIDYFKQYPDKAWPLIKDMFFNVIDKAKPNAAHQVLADWESKGLLKAIITQNIDNLHQKAGNKNVIEFHGNTRDLVCLDCQKITPVKEADMQQNPVSCPHCGGLLKPDFVFFGEPIPPKAYASSLEHTNQADVYLIIGTTGIIMPASLIPYEAKKNGAKIIEVNVTPSNYTSTITDIFLQGKAGEVLTNLKKLT